MILVFTSILSFVASWLPELIKLFQRKQDNQHEYKMMSLQREIAAQNNMHRVEMKELDFAATEVEVLHREQAFGSIEILRALRSATWIRWYTAPLIIPALYLFVVVDWINAAIRPGIALAVVALYGAMKWQAFQASHVIDFTTDDYMLLFTVVGFFFGGRMIAKRSK